VSAIHALLLTYRRPSAFERALSQIVEADPRPDRLVVVDNAPSERSRATGEGAAARHDWITYIPSSTNLGPAGGRALAMERLLPGAGDRDWLVFLDDDDPLPDPGVLGRVRAFAEDCLARDPRTGGAAVRGARFDRRRGYPFPVLRAGQRGAIAVDYLHGGFFPFYPVPVVREVGIFQADLFFGWADLEYGLRLRRAGYRLYASADLWGELEGAMGHPPERTAPDRSLGPADARRYYTMRNRYHLLRTYGGPLAATRVFLVAGVAKPIWNLPSEPGLAFRHLRLNLRAALDSVRRRYGVGPEPWASEPPSPVEE